MIDYELKAKIIDLGLDKTMKRIDKAQYELYANGIVNPYLDNLYCDILFKHGSKMIDEARKVYQASSSRNSRLRKRISRFLEMGNCLFLTLEFSPECLDHTSKETRRSYVSKFLKSQCDYYVANIDYGDKRGREHYHALVVADYVNLDEWKHGFMFSRRVILPNSDMRIPKYINKLTNHAIKHTTKRNYVIYSRTKY